MSAASQGQKQRLEREVSRLRGLRTDLERDWRKLPYFLAPVVLALPAFFIWGPFASAVVVLGSVTMALSAAYLMGVRRKEYDADIREVVQEIVLLEAAETDAD